MRIYSFSKDNQTLEIPAESMDEAITELPIHWKRANQPIQLTVIISPAISEAQYWKARAHLLEHKLFTVLGGSNGTPSNQSPLA